MTPIPLEGLGIGWRSHLSALWLLGLLYRRPQQLDARPKQLQRRQALRVAALLYLHALPWMVIVCLAGRYVVFGVLQLPSASALPTDQAGLFVTHLRRIAGGIAVGIAGALSLWIAGGITSGDPFWRSRWSARGIAFGILIGVAFGITVGIAPGIASGVVNGIAVGFLFGISIGIQPQGRVFFGITLAIGATVAVAILGWIASGITFGITLGIAGGITVTRAYYFLIQPLFVWPTPRGRWYPLHPVAWDDLCSVPFFGLDRLLLAYAGHDRAAADQEIERLVSSYPSQRFLALRAQTALIARDAGREADLTMLPQITGRLPRGDKRFLRRTDDVRDEVAKIAQLQVRLNTVERPILREPLARALRAEIDSFSHRIGGFEEPLASEFRAAAKQWLAVADRQLDEASGLLAKEPTVQVFRAGDPVDRSQEAFVLRDSIVGELDQQIMLASGCPGLVLYGRRRMGKSTLLHNLSGFLPSSVHIVTISMQSPAAFTSLESLTDLLSKEIAAVMPDGGNGREPARDLPSFFRMLTSYNAALEQGGTRLLLAIDEYENIDEKLGAGVFSGDLLATIRESIQSHRRITWIFVGVHGIDELSHAPWPSYLVSARTVDVPPFTEAETRLLLTEPLKHSTLWSHDETKRPRFQPEFWGDGGIERIHAEAGGWPHLVQLIAETVVDLVNQTLAPAVTPELMNQALDKAVGRGENVLRELLERECSLPGEWDYLRAFRRRDTQPPPDDEAVYRSLRRRLLVAEENGDWRLRVPLMQRWLRQRG